MGSSTRIAGADPDFERDRDRGVALGQSGFSSPEGGAVHLAAADAT